MKLKLAFTGSGRILPIELKGLIIFFLFNLLILNTYAQVSEGGIPYAFLNTQMSKHGLEIPTYNLPFYSNDSLIQKVEEMKRDCPNCNKSYWGIKHDIKIDIIAKGEKVIADDKGVLWLYRISSAQAYGLQLYFERFKLPEGAKLFIYNETRTMVLGAFTSNNNREDMRLATQPIIGDSIILEYFEPNNSAFNGELCVSSVVHDFKGLLIQSGPYGTAGICHVNVKCPQGNGWEEETNSVALILIYDANTNLVSTCSGNLINNTAQNGTPYFLTASHCAGSAGANEYWNWVFLFNHESNTCTGTYGPTTHSISGATLKKIGVQNLLINNDYLLLELNETPPSSYNACYAGWDLSSSTTTTSVTGIHHPAGDIKKITVDNSTPTLTNLSGITLNYENYEVTDPDIGDFEPGSSGSALFDVNHRIIGIADYTSTPTPCVQKVVGFFRFSVAYKPIYGNFSQWLDPINTNPLTTNTFCPKSDLTIINHSVSNPTTNPGGTISVCCAVNNQSNVPASPSVVSLHISSDAILTPAANGDIYVGELQIPTIPSNATSLVSCDNIIIPTSVLPGNYSLFFSADGGQTVNESDELNNFATQQITITSNAGCTLSNIVPTAVSPGTTTNPGTAISTTTPTLTWNAVSGANNYDVSIQQDPPNGTPYPYNCVGNVTSFTVPAGVLVNGGNYRWNVQANDNCGTCESFYADPLYFNVNTGCNYSLSATTANFTMNGGIGSFTVNTGSSCNWTASTNQPGWISFSNSSGTGTDNVVYSIGPSTGSSRTGYIYVGGQTFSVFQAGSPPAPGLYWIGGTGDWSDGSNWSNSSGGASCNCIPTMNDNVYFDGNSFWANGQGVTIDQSAYCKDIKWANISNTIILTGTASLNINGSLTLISNLNLTYSGPISFTSDQIGNTITSAGKQLSSITFNNYGEWTLLDNLNIGSQSITLNKGSLITNNKTINAGRFESNNSNFRSLSLGNSIINLSYCHYHPSLATWNIGGSNMSLDAGTSTINLTGSNESSNFNGGGKAYYNVCLKNTNLQFNSIINSENNIFNSLTFEGSGAIQSTNQIGTLVLFPGISLYIVGTQTITDNIQANGTCSNLINISNGTIKKLTGSISLNYLRLLNTVALGGAVFTANNSTDLGGNSGWIINYPTSQNLYWIGGTGEWTDPSHWSLNSGGPSSGCIPSPYNSVYFDANSFFANGQGVTINQTAYCKDMTWFNVTNNPIFAGTSSLNINGSLTLISNMNLTYFGPISFTSDQIGNTITSAGKQLSSITFNNYGEWTLLDNLNIGSQSITLNKGSLITNNKTINAGRFESNNSNFRSLSLGNSIINLSYCHYHPSLATWNIGGSNMSLDAGTSTINLTGSNESSNFNGGGKAYYNVCLKNTNLQFNSIINSENNIFNSLTFEGSGAIQSANQVGTLVLFPGVNLNISGTQTIVNSVQANGSFSEKINISNGVLYKTNGLICIINTKLTNTTATGGAYFFADNSSDLGGNTGWIFAPCASLPADPGAPTVSNITCTNATLTRSSPPPTGILYYWQGTTTGTSKTLGSGVTYNATASGTYYLRAYDPATNVWSSGYGSVQVVLQPFPSSPVVTSPVTLCQYSTATSLTASGTNLLWYTSASGGTPSATPPIPTTNAVGNSVFYVSQTVNGCESPLAGIDVIVTSAPAGPVVVSPVGYCLNVNPASLVASGNNLLWYTNPTGGTGTGTAPVPGTNTPGTVTYYVTQNTGGCESQRTPVQVITYSPPVSPTVTSPVGYCQNATASALAANGSNLLWYTVPAGGTGSATAPVPATTTIGTTTYYVSQTLNGCEGNRASIDVDISQPPAAPTVSGTITYCENSTASPLTATGSNLLWYTTPSGGIGQSQAPVPSTSISGTTTYYVSQTLNGCESSRTPVSVSVVASPSAPVVSSSVSYCHNTVASSLTATGSNLLWYTTPTGGLGNWPGPTPSTANIGSTTYYVSQTVNGCESQRAGINVIIDAIPSQPQVTSPVSYCQNSSASALTATGSNLQWYNLPTGGTGMATPPTPGTAIAGMSTHYVSQTVNGCESPRASIDVTIISAPAGPSTTTPVNYCENSAAAPLSAIGNTLLWYLNSTGGTGTSVAPTPVTNLPGTSHYYVSQTVGGCESNRKMIDVIVHPFPALPAVSSPITFCQNAPAPSLTASGTGLLWYTAPTGGQGVWPGPTPSTANVGSTTYYVSQTVNGCEGPRAGITVQISPVPALPGVSSPVVYCQNAIAQPLSAIGGNILWYSVPTGGTGSGTAPVPNTTFAGVSSQYVSQTINGCESQRASIDLIINALPTNPVVTSPINYCQNDAATSLTATGTNVLWYTAPTGGTGSSVAPTPSTSTTGSTSFYVSQSSGGCESNRSTIGVNVSALPSAPIVTNPVTYCQNSTSLPLTATGTNLLWYLAPTGGQGTWPGPTPGTSTPGSTSHYVSQTVNGCESPRAQINVITNPIPSSPVVISPASYCEGTPATPLTAIGSNLLWYLSATGGTGLINPPVPSTAAPGITTYYVSQTVNGCESARDSIVCQVFAIPAPPIVASPLTYCQNSTAIPLTATGTNLLWYATATGVVGSTVPPIPTTLTLGTTFHYVTQTLNGCESLKDSIRIDVITTPNLAGPISGLSPVCQNQNGVTYTIPLLNGATNYVWTLPGGATGQSTTSTILVNYGASAQSGSITVAGQNICGTGASASKFITLVPAPVANAGSDTSVCPGYPVTLIASGGNSYTWSHGASQGVPIIPDSSTTYTVTVSNGYCTSTDSVRVTVYDPPEQPIIYQVGNDLLSTVTNGNQWYVDTAMIAGAIAATYTPIKTGNYYVLVTDSNGCTSDTSNILYFVVSGISGTPLMEQNVRIYPNPASDRITIEIIDFHASDDLTFELYNIEGQMVKRLPLVSNQTVIDLMPFSSGMYIIKLTGNNGILLQRVLKE